MICKSKNSTKAIRRRRKQGDHRTNQEHYSQYPGHIGMNMRHKVEESSVQVRKIVVVIGANGEGLRIMAAITYFLLLYCSL